MQNTEHYILKLKIIPTSSDKYSTLKKKINPGEFTDIKYLHED